MINFYNKNSELFYKKIVFELNTSLPVHARLAQCLFPVANRNPIDLKCQEMQLLSMLT